VWSVQEGHVDAAHQVCRKATWMLHIKLELEQQEGEESGVLAEMVLEVLVRHGRLR
jgi:hypothetical protein